MAAVKNPEQARKLSKLAVFQLSCQSYALEGIFYMAQIRRKSDMGEFMTDPARATELGNQQVCYEKEHTFTKMFEIQRA
jgi:hypothetical protein